MQLRTRVEEGGTPLASKRGIDSQYSRLWHVPVGPIDHFSWQAGSAVAQRSERIHTVGSGSSTSCVASAASDFVCLAGVASAASDFASLAGAASVTGELASAADRASVTGVLALRPAHLREQL